MHTQYTLINLDCDRAIGFHDVLKVIQLENKWVTWGNSLMYPHSSVPTLWRTMHESTELPFHAHCFHLKRRKTDCAEKRQMEPSDKHGEQANTIKTLSSYSLQNNIAARKALHPWNCLCMFKLLFTLYSFKFKRRTKVSIWVWNHHRFVCSGVLLLIEFLVKG